MDTLQLIMDLALANWALTLAVVLLVAGVMWDGARTPPTRKRERTHGHNTRGGLNPYEDLE
jgi:hypothetical protein